MIDFKELKLVIQKASIVDKTDISSRFHFSIDVEKLEQLLAANNTDLHVIAGTKNIVSKVPGIEDIQFISEYITKKEQFSYIFNGSTNVASLILYCDMNGTFKIGTESEEIDKDVLFNKLNNEEDIDIGIVNTLVSETPIYRALIIRKFNVKEDKFDYSIFFRSNRNMINYIKELKEEGSFGTESDNDSVEDKEKEE